MRFVFTFLVFLLASGCADQIRRPSSLFDENDPDRPTPAIPHAPLR